MSKVRVCMCVFVVHAGSEETAQLLQLLMGRRALLEPTASSHTHYSCQAP